MSNELLLVLVKVAMAFCVIGFLYHTAKEKNLLATFGFLLKHLSWLFVLEALIVLLGLAVMAYVWEYSHADATHKIQLMAGTFIGSGVLMLAIGAIFGKKGD